MINKGSREIVKKYSNFEKLFGGVQFLCAKFIKEHQSGKVNPGKVNQIADAIDKALKGMRLINNESTENVSTNWHISLLNEIEKEEKENGEHDNGDGDNFVNIPGRDIGDGDSGT